MLETTLARYYRTLDEGRIDDALQLLDPDVRFVMVLPAPPRRGHGPRRDGRLPRAAAGSRTAPTS